MGEISERGSLLRNISLQYHLVRKRGEPPISEAEKIGRLINLTNDIVGIAKDYKVRYVALEGYAHNKRFWRMIEDDFINGREPEE
jgi:hypothetical protein